MMRAMASTCSQWSWRTEGGRSLSFSSTRSADTSPVAADLPCFRLAIAHILLLSASSRVSDDTLFLAN